MHADLHATVSASAAFGGFFVLLMGATGTGCVATSPTLGATCSCFFATSGALSAWAAAYGERGSRNQAGDTKPCQNFLQVLCVHNDLL